MQKPDLTLDINNIKKEFPILNRKINGKKLVYLDSAATSQKPQYVLDAMNHFYEHYNANIHRGVYTISEEATEGYELAHKKVSDFINAGGMEEIIFTKNTTESLNLIAYSLTSKLNNGDEIVLTQMEHHSNLVPWQQIAKQRGLILRFIKLNKNGTLNEESINETINKKTKIVSVTHVSNVLGAINDVKKISKIAREKNALIVVDGAQSVPHMKIDVKDIDCDFLAFSAHKMFGPLGIGILYGKKHLLEKMPPFLYGGDMIREVSFGDTSFNDLPWKFEAGTPNVAGAIGLGAAIDYIKKIGIENIEQYDKSITKYALEKLSEIKNLEIYGPADIKTKGAVVSFNIKGVHSHDVAEILDSDGIAVRAGHHCCMPLMGVLGVTATARASFYLYNDFEEIDKLVDGIKKIKKVFKIS